MRLPGRGQAIYVAAMLVFWLLVTSFTASSVMAVYSAPRALVLNPFNATAKAQVANDMVYVTGDANKTGTAARLSREALDGNASLAVAYRMIALDNARSGKPVKPMILAATYLTRRDYVANLWLIEDAVKRGRLDQAMSDVDASLRTSRRGQALLFPIIARAVTEPDMRPQFQRLFRADPDWLPGFLGYYINSREKAAPLAQIILPIRGDLPPNYRSLDGTLINLMVGQQDFDAARAYERAIAGPAAREDVRIVHNGRFEAEGPYPPIDWHLFREAAYGSDIEKSAKGNRLVVLSDQEAPALVARQLVELSPGRYRISTRGQIMTGNDEAALRWQVGCAEAGGPGRLVELPIERGNAPAVAVFTVPAGSCRNYWLSLTAAAGFGSAPLQAEFQSIDLRRLP